MSPRNINMVVECLANNSFIADKAASVRLGVCSLFGCTESYCSFCLFGFAVSLCQCVNLMKMFSEFHGVSPICMCFLKLQIVDLSGPPYA